MCVDIKHAHERARARVQVTSDPTYGAIAKETLDYVQRVMENKDLGGFYSAEDADSEGEEGKFYVWTKKEIFDILGPQVLARPRCHGPPLSRFVADRSGCVGPQEAERFCEVYGVTEKGNFEHHTNHLNLLGQRVSVSSVVGSIG
jgi:uncharacterized protein YyaL (SSP411 family)